MIISVISDDDNDAGNNPTRKKGPLPISTPSSSASRPFWGVNVTPEQPVTVTFRNHRRLHITKAILGEPCLDEFAEDRSVLVIKHGDNPEVYLCSVREKISEMVSLDFDLEGPHDIVFTVRGPRGIHLVGYFFDELSATDVDDPPIGGGAIEKSLSRILIENDLQGKGIADIVGEPVIKEGSYKILVPGLFEVLKQLPMRDASLQPPITKQHELQIEAVSEYMTATNQGDKTIVQEDKQQGTNSARRKLYLEMQEPENGQVNENEKEREYKTKRRRKNKHLEAPPNADRVDEDSDECGDKRERKRKNKHVVALQNADRVDGEDDERDDRRKRKAKNKHPVNADRIDEDSGKGSSKHDSPLTHSGEVQKQKNKNKKQIAEGHDDIRSAQHGHPEDPAQHDQPNDPSQHDQPEDFALDIREAKKSKKRSKMVVTDNKVRSAQHGRPEDPAHHGQLEDPAHHDQLEDPAQYDRPKESVVDTREAEKPKKRSKKVKDSEVRSAQHGQPEDPAQHGQLEDPAQYDLLEDPALDTREAKKSKKRSKKVVKDSEDRSAQHDGQLEDPAHHCQPEDPAQNEQLEDPAHHYQSEEPAVDTREAKKSKNRNKKVKDSEVRSPTRTSARTSAHTSVKQDVEPVKMRENVPGSRPLIVCGLPAFAKR